MTTILVGVWILCEAVVFLLARPRGLREFDFILVLGNKEGGSSPVVRDRAANAAEAHKLFSAAKIVLTGNERLGEVSTLKKFLLEEGITEVIEEGKSESTEQNMEFSRPLMGNDPRVLVVTSEYHQRRSLVIARSCGMKAEVFGKDRTAYPSALRYFAKERAAVILSAPRMLHRLMRG